MQLRALRFRPLQPKAHNFRSKMASSSQVSLCDLYKSSTVASSDDVLQLWTTTIPSSRGWEKLKMAASLPCHGHLKHGCGQRCLLARSKGLFLTLNKWPATCVSLSSPSEQAQRIQEQVFFSCLFFWRGEGLNYIFAYLLVRPMGEGEQRDRST